MEAALRWYVVHTQPRGEGTALRHLKRQGFAAFLPEYLKRRSHARRLDWVRAPLFPRYLFVAMDVASARWRAIASTMGVSHLVCNGEEPAAVPRGVVEDIRARIGEGGLVKLEPHIPFRPGDAVKVLVGAFADQIGFFQCATDEARVVLLLDMLGRRVTIKLPLADVAPAA